MRTAIFRTVWELKKEGYAESTIEGFDKKLRLLSRISDLSCPDTVRSAIARRDVSGSFKEKLVEAYDHFVRVNGLEWTKPFYKRQRRLPYVASVEQLAKIISRSSRMYALIFTLLKDTGLRPVELHRLTLKDVDLEKGVIFARSTKFGDPRVLSLKPSVLAMLREYCARHDFGLNDTMFPSPSAVRHSFERYRNDVANKLHDPTLKKIRLYDLRHHFASMLYFKTKDILYVKEQLGHKRLENTLIYTHLVDFGEIEFVCKAAKSSEEASQLIEQNFDYVLTTPEGTMLFRKPK